MGFHPANLAIRFLLELCMLVALGVWGWRAGAPGWRGLLVVLLPVLAATLWGVFAVPGDASRSGAAPVAVPGWVRLGLELSLFVVAVIGLRATGADRAAAFLGIAVAVHYLISYDRIVWLLRH